MEPEVRARHNLTPGEIDDLENRLYEFNASRTGYRDAAQLAFTATVNGELVGAVAGYTWGGVCELRQVWVHEAHRLRGLGATLLNEAIKEARTRGCAHMFLATFDFQAPGFYTKMGFRPVAKIRDKPLGHTDLVMHMAL
jgi:N-acetylglutamate synthase-like GNAT family acetyltransferase